MKAGSWRHRVAPSRAGRGPAADATWIFRGTRADRVASPVRARGQSTLERHGVARTRRRRGCHVDRPRARTGSRRGRRRRWLAGPWAAGRLARPWAAGRLALRLADPCFASDPGELGGARTHGNCGGRPQPGRDDRQNQVRRDARRPLGQRHEHRAPQLLARRPRAAPRRRPVSFFVVSSWHAAATSTREGPRRRDVDVGGATPLRRRRGREVSVASRGLVGERLQATHAGTITRLKEALAKRPGVHCAVMLDTKGPEIRTGFFAPPYADKKIELTAGATLVLTTDYDHKPAAARGDAAGGVRSRRRRVRDADRPRPSAARRGRRRRGAKRGRRSHRARRGAETRRCRRGRVVAATPWIVRGDESRRRRGRDVDSPRGRRAGEGTRAREERSTDSVGRLRRGYDVIIREDTSWRRR